MASKKLYPFNAKLLRKTTEVVSGKIGKAVVTIMGGALIAQIISVICLPIITRLYTPEAIGVQSIFMSVGNMVATAAALTYPLAIVLPEKNSDAKYISVLSILIGVISSVLILIVIVIFDSFTEKNLPKVGNLAYLLPLFVLFSVFGVISSQYLVREKKFGRIAQTSWQISAVLNGAKLLIGSFHASATVLVIIAVLSGLVRALLSLRYLNVTALKPLLGAIFPSFKEIKRISVDYQDFPKYRAPQAVVAAVSQGSLLVLFSILFDKNLVGQLSLAVTVLSLPLNFVGSAVNQVMYPILNDAIKQKKNITGDLISIALLIGAISAPIFILLGFSGQMLFGLIFGESWRVAGQFAAWLTFYMFVEFISRPAVAAIPVLKLQKGFLIYESALFAVKILTMFVAFKLNFSAVNMIIVYSISCALVAMLLLAWILRVSLSTNPKYLNDRKS